MEIEIARCECCGLKEECTQDYISDVKSRFEGKWLCGLCSQAVVDEASASSDLKLALNSHMSFCRKFNLNPAIKVADGLRQMLRKRSSSPPSSSKTEVFSRSATMPRIGGSAKTSLRLY